MSLLLLVICACIAVSGTLLAVVVIRVRTYSEATALVRQLGDEGSKLLLNPAVSDNAKDHFRSAVALTLAGGRAKYALGELPKQTYSSHGADLKSARQVTPTSNLPPDALLRDVLAEGLIFRNQLHPYIAGNEVPPYSFDAPLRTSEEMIRVVADLSHYQELMRPGMGGPAMLEAALAVRAIDISSLGQFSVTYALQSDALLALRSEPKDN